MSSRPRPGHTILALLGLLCVFVLTLLVVARLDPQAQRHVLREGGLVETLTLIGYITVAVLLIWRMLRFRNSNAWPLVFIVLAMAGRELDLDKRLFIEGLFKSRQYIGSDVAMPERLISFAILLALLALIYFAARRYGRILIDGLRTGAMPAWLAVSGIILAALAKSIDGIDRKLAPLGTSLQQSTGQTVAMFEEIGEFCIPLAFIASILMAAPPLTQQSLFRAAPDRSPCRRPAPYRAGRDAGTATDRSAPPVLKPRQETPGRQGVRS